MRNLIRFIPILLFCSILSAIHAGKACAVDAPGPGTGPSSGLVLYPGTLFSELQSRIYFELPVLSEYGGIERVAIHCFNTERICEGLTYKNKDGQLRYCGAFGIPADVAPGRYPVRVSAYYARKEVLAYGTVAVKSRSSGCPRNPVRSENSRAASLLHTERTLKSGNFVHILNDGPGAFQKWKELLSQARRRIDLQTYYVNDSEKCAELVDLLKQKIRSGVEVNLLVTRYAQIAKAPLALKDLRREGARIIMVGAIGFPDHKNESSQFWLDRMRKNYRILSSLPQTPAFTKWMEEEGKDLTVDFAPHEKMLIVDDAKAIVGGRNIDDNYFRWWIDADCYLEGPIVEDIRKAFEDNWKEFGGTIEPLAQKPASSVSGKNTDLQLVHSKPWQGRYTALDMIRQAIAEAKKSIYITSQYLALPPEIENALTGAALRGIDVRILTNSYETGRAVAFSLGHIISLNYYRPLLAAGVRIFESRGNGETGDRRPYIHAKEYIIDGSLVSIGSFNLSIRSAFLESEMMINIYDSDIAQFQERLFLRLLEQSDPITPCDLAVKEDDLGLFMNLARRLEILY